MRLLLSHLAVALLLLGLPVVGQAQADEAQRRATARLLFEEGLEFSDDERWAEAAEVYERAYRLYPSGPIALNWGLALAHEGRFVAATEAFRRVLRHEDAPEPQRLQAQTQLDRLEPLLASVTVDPISDGEPAVEGFEVLLDGYAIPPQALGVPLPLDPGEHRLVARRGEDLGPPRELVVAEGERAQLEVEVPAPPAPAPETVALTVSPPNVEVLTGPTDAGPDVTGEPWFWGVLFSGVAVVVAGVITAVVLSLPSAADPVCEDLSLGCVPLGR